MDEYYRLILAVQGCLGDNVAPGPFFKFMDRVVLPETGNSDDAFQGNSNASGTSLKGI